MATKTSFKKGPYLLAAFLCEKVLTESDGVKSAIRIVDRVTRTGIGPKAPQKMRPFDYEIALLIKLKSGAARGPYPLRIALRKPTRKNPPPLELTVSFEEDRGADVVVQLRIRFDREGLYWIDIYLRNMRLTRIPLRVVYVTQPKQKRVGKVPPGS